MSKCPNCKAKVSKVSKKWKYGHFSVEAFDCSHCGTKFRDYAFHGKYSFTLKFKKGKGFIKA